MQYLQSLRPDDHSVRNCFLFFISSNSNFSALTLLVIWHRQIPWYSV